MLFKAGKFKSHSGLELDWKIDCDALTDEDIECLASIIASRFKFRYVYGIPEGGIRLEKALWQYASVDSSSLLVVDDVLTTGKSMNALKARYNSGLRKMIGVVIFARGPCPEWVTPIFQLHYGWGGSLDITLQTSKLPRWKPQVILDRRTLEREED
jgi:hypothetical protein